MAGYKLRWITDNLAVGSAPMSEEDLEHIRSDGITCIVNLCGEFCDLADIEKDSGFDVFYLPVDDDSVPAMEEMERALEWLDEAVFLGKKILVHCRLGLGRTGTFINSYLLRKGFGLKQAQRRLKHIKSTPSSYYQWDLLRKYERSNKRLTVREPSIEGRRLVDLSPYFLEYETLVTEIQRTIDENLPETIKTTRCGIELNSPCCRSPFKVQLIEAAYLQHSINRWLSRQERMGVIERALSINENDPEAPYLCPLSQSEGCLIYKQRPLRCRTFDLMGLPFFEEGYKGRTKQQELAYSRINPEALETSLHEISRHLYLALNATFLNDRGLQFSIVNVLSGRFVQDYFSYTVKLKRSKGD